MTHLLAIVLLAFAAFLICVVLMLLVLFHQPPLEEGYPAETPRRRLQVTRGEVVPLDRKERP